MARARQTSRSVFSPCGVSSFFEICDRNLDGSKIEDPLRIGARGGGFIIKRGNTTQASFGRHIRDDRVVINGRTTPEARTSLRVIKLVREKYNIPPVIVTHFIEPPVGSGFGTSGAGAVGTAIALSDLFDLHFTLSRASSFAHISEVESITGLGTVLSLVSGNGAIGLVTEPGSYSIGRADSIIGDYSEFSLICACFGPIEKSTVLNEEKKRSKVNEFGRKTLEAILDEPTSESLLRHSRRFAKSSGLASKDLLKLADRACRDGAIGATQNMIGNAVHCLVQKSKRKRFLESFRQVVPKNSLFETELVQCGPFFVQDR
ncbi:MAG: GHMP family kinase ATP-binding protein [Nitrososphaerales archaeon]